MCTNNPWVVDARNGEVVGHHKHERIWCGRTGGARARREGALPGGPACPGRCVGCVEAGGDGGATGVAGDGAPASRRAAAMSMCTSLRAATRRASAAGVPASSSMRPSGVRFMPRRSAERSAAMNASDVGASPSVLARLSARRLSACSGSDLMLRKVLRTVKAGPLLSGIVMGTSPGAFAIVPRPPPPVGARSSWSGGSFDDAVPDPGAATTTG
eukprot:16452370-Heterocapsa_arctica.AAC.1